MRDASAHGRSSSEDSLNLDLISAAFQADESRVQELLARGAQVHAKLGTYRPSKAKGSQLDLFSYAGSENWTPLLALAHNERATNHTAIAQRLLDAGADINAEDSRGGTALSTAIQSSQSRPSLEAFALYLIRRGADVNTRMDSVIDGPGKITPLHQAVGNSQLLRKLIEKGAHLNARDSEGRTPLHYASIRRNRESVQILIQAGADIRIKDSKGDTFLREIEHDEEMEAYMDRTKSVSEK